MDRMSPPVAPTALGPASSRARVLRYPGVRILASRFVAALPRARNGAGRRCSGSRREAEVHHVAVGDGVLLAFEPELAGIACARLAAAGHVVVIRDGLGADE